MSINSAAGRKRCILVQRLADHYHTAILPTRTYRRRALALDAVNYPSIASKLKTKLDQQLLPGQEEGPSPVAHHDNIRGQAYYQTPEALNDSGCGKKTTPWLLA